MVRPLVGAALSMLINELAQELVCVDVGELQLTPVISTGYGFGLVISK